MKEQRAVGGRYHPSISVYLEDMEMEIMRQNWPLFEAAELSIKTTNPKVGTAVWIGTGGDLTTCENTKKLFQSNKGEEPKYFIPPHCRTEE